MTLRAYPVGGPVRVLVDFPPDGDGTSAFAFRQGSATEIFYTRYFCDRETNTTDLYKVVES